MKLTQTLPVTKSPSELVVEGILPSDQTSPGAKHPLKLVVEDYAFAKQQKPPDQKYAHTRS